MNQYISSVGEKNDIAELLNTYENWRDLRPEVLAFINAGEIYYHAQDLDGLEDVEVSAPDIHGSYALFSNYWTSAHGEYYYRNAYLAEIYSGGFYMNRSYYGTGASIRCIARNNGGSGEGLYR